MDGHRAAENLGEPLQVAVIRSGCVLRRRLGWRLRLGLRLDGSGLRWRLKLRLVSGLRLLLRLPETLGVGGAGAETKQYRKNDRGSEH